MPRYAIDVVRSINYYTIIEADDKAKAKKEVLKQIRDFGVDSLLKTSDNELAMVKVEEIANKTKDGAEQLELQF